MAHGHHVGTTATFKKGMMVRVAPQLDYRGEVKTAWDTKKVLCNRMWRPRTEAEHTAWRESDDSKGRDGAGETKLDSPSRGRTPDADETFKIVRARVAASSGWHTIKGCAEIIDTEGVCWFIERKFLH
jgi:hypothetical protein